MPYLNEFSKHKSLVDIANSNKLKNFLNKIKIKNIINEKIEDIDNLVPSLETANSNFFKKCVAIDGSKYDLDIEVGLPGAKIAIININITNIDLKLMVEYESSDIPCPLNYNKIFDSHNFELIVPTYNIVDETQNNTCDLFRKTLHEFLISNSCHSIFSKFDVSETKISFLDTLNNLINSNKTNISAKNPCNICFSNGYESIDLNHVLNGKCNCSNNPVELYLSDLLKLHESFNENSSNMDISTQLMSLMEKIITVNYIENLTSILKEKNCLEKIEEILFVLDGPLAIYNNSSWLSEKIYIYLNKISEEKISMIGIEKSGHFVEHLEQIALVREKSGRELKNGFLFYLNDNYIKNYIKYSNSSLPYGYQQYFGKKFFYKNINSNLFVINHLFKSNKDKNLYHTISNNIEYVSTQNDICKILKIINDFDSTRYKNALSFISMAHENVSISNNSFSSRVMNDVVCENMNEGALISEHQNKRS